MGLVATIHDATLFAGGHKPGDVTVRADGRQHLRKHNLAALIDPTVEDDATQGYEVGSTWINAQANRFFVSTGAEAGVARWLDLTAVGTPVGVEGSIQYKSASHLAGDDNLKWNAGQLTVVGAISASGAITGGNVTSGVDPGHSHTAYSLADHRHDDQYAAIDHIHEGGVYAAIDHLHTGVYAPADHNHDGVYSPVGHDHWGVYAEVEHSHDSSYAALTHHHDAQYAAVGHDHDAQYDPLGSAATVQAMLSSYALATHNHDGSYAVAGHNHDLSYAPLSHNHDSSYAAASHDHAGTYEPALSAGSTAQYWRGDKTWQTLDKAAVGLGNVENTALSTWSGSANISMVGTLGSLTVTGTVAAGTVTGENVTSGVDPGHTHTAYAESSHSHAGVYDAVGTAAAAVSVHEAAYDHASYLTAVTTWRGVGLAESFTAPTDGQIPVYRGATGGWVLEGKPDGGSNPALSDVTDVTLTGPVGGNELLAYDTGTGHWINRTASELGIAVTDHTHDDVYAAASHNHDLAYAALSHHHDADYAAASHDHTGVYSPLGHDHTGVYAPATHNHDLAYAGLIHNHDASYAAASHDHTGTYEPVIAAGTIGQYWRGDKTWWTLDKAAVGLANVENVALSTWVGSNSITTVGTLASLTINASSGSPLTVQVNGQNALVIDSSNNATFSGNVTTSGSLLLPNGTETAPAVAAAADTDTGLCFPADDQLGLSVGGNQVLWLQGGNVSVTNGSTIYWQLTNSALTGDPYCPGAPYLKMLGTVVSPTYSFVGDTNTGLYSPADDQLGLATGGVLRLKIDASGATTVNAVAGNPWTVNLNSVPAMEINSSRHTTFFNRVGIGVSPLAQLHIESNVNASLGVRIANPNAGESAYADLTCLSDSGSMTVRAFSSAYMAPYGGNSMACTGVGADLMLGTDEVFRLIVKHTTGRIGIGTSAPDKMLEINSATGACLRLTYNGANGNAAVYSDLDVSSSGYLTVASSGARIGFGCVPANAFHIRTGVSGYVADTTISKVTLESSGAAFLQLLTPNSAASGILFSDNDLSAGYLQYDHVSNRMTLRSATETQLLVGSGSLAITPTSISCNHASLVLSNNAASFVANVASSAGLSQLVARSDLTNHEVKLITYGSTYAAMLFGIPAADMGFLLSREMSLAIGTTGVKNIHFATNNTVRATLTTAAWELADAINLAFNTATGTKIGTSTAQKLAFWNATPISQPAGIASADGTLTDVTSKFNSLLGKLQSLGLLAAA